MQAIRSIQKSVDGTLTIKLPDGFVGQEVEVIVLLPTFNSTEQEPVPTEVQEHTERYLVAQQFKGDALFPDFPTDELNVYEQ